MSNHLHLHLFFYIRIGAKEWWESVEWDAHPLLEPFGRKLSSVDLSIMKYGESSIAVSIDPLRGELHELWVMKEYGVEDGEVLLRVRKVKMASLDLNSQQMGDSLYLNCQQINLHGVDVGANLLSADSYVESIVNTDIIPKKSIPAAVAVNLAEEMGKVGSNSSPSFAAILQLALQREYQDSTEKIIIRSHIG
ncbi:hypothetical protein V6N11_079277 [Hibiscus sabdariffa]|uniref:Uncharacterized protein n=1 Tax=Hibiscus sabdariffa TaxID=183260 RepID=A0ABR2RV33_9ROSI